MTEDIAVVVFVAGEDDAEHLRKLIDSLLALNGYRGRAWIEVGGEFYTELPRPVPPRQPESER